jgi:hypothetical protein
LTVKATASVFLPWICCGFTENVPHRSRYRYICREKMCRAAKPAIFHGKFVDYAVAFAVTAFQH